MVEGKQTGALVTYRFPAPSRSTDFGKAVLRYLVRSGLRAQLNRQRSHTPLLDQDGLVRLLDELLFTKGRDFIDNDPSSGRRRAASFSTEQGRRWAATAAESVMVRWDGDFLNRASRGGKTSKRGPKFTDADYARVAHLSKAEAARELECSESTVARRRREALADAPRAEFDRLTRLGVPEETATLLTGYTPEQGTTGPEPEVTQQPLQAAPAEPYEDMLLDPTLDTGRPSNEEVHARFDVLVAEMRRDRELLDLDNLTPEDMADLLS